MFILIPLLSALASGVTTVLGAATTAAAAGAAVGGGAGAATAAAGAAVATAATVKVKIPPGKAQRMRWKGARPCLTMSWWNGCRACRRSSNCAATLANTC